MKLEDFYQRIELEGFGFLRLLALNRGVAFKYKVGFLVSTDSASWPRNQEYSEVLLDAGEAAK